MVFDYNNLDHCVTKVDVHASFCYSTDPINLPDFKVNVNLIADSNELQFFCKLNFLLL